MALMAGLGILAAGVAIIASRTRAERPSEGSTIEAVRAAAELIRLRMDGADSGPRRRALKAAAGRMKPELAMGKALAYFAEGNLDAGVKEPATSPFAHGVRGWMLFELGRRPEAAEAINQALKDAPPEWEFRSLFEEARRKADPR
jgi:hypothetical protein